MAVQNAVQNGIENLSGTSLSSNAHPEDGYRFRARTKDELLASQQLAAGNGTVHAGKRVLDPAVTELKAPEWEDDEQTAVRAPSRIIVPGATPRPTPPKAPQGWIL